MSRVVERYIDLLTYLPFLSRVPVLRRLPVFVVRRHEVRVVLDVEAQIDWKDEVALSALVEAAADAQAKLIVKEADNCVRCESISARPRCPQ